MELSGGEILIEALKEEEVEFIFGYPGGAVLHIYDALYEQNSVKHILVRHEQGATHAADGYARATGKPGVVLVTSGPGATNAVTGIATAFMDSIPMVILSGQVQSRFIGSDAFQEVDCVVVVDIPKDFTAPAVKVPFVYPKEISMRSYAPAVQGHPGQIRKAVDLILSAKRPMIYSGGGVVLGEAAEQLIDFTRELGYPITIDSFCPNAKIVHVDVDPASISKTVTVDVPIVGHVGQVLEAMITLLRETDRRPDQEALAVWWKRLRDLQATDCLAYETSSELIKPQAVVEALHKVTQLWWAGHDGFWFASSYRRAACVPG